jgi:hypothetical protein
MLDMLFALHDQLNNQLLTWYLWNTKELYCEVRHPICQLCELVSKLYSEPHIYI